MHKYTRVARCQDEVEVMRIIDLVQVKKDILRYVQDVKAVRGKGQDHSDHFVLCKVRLLVRLIKRRGGK